MEYFPIFTNIKDKPCLVVGAGAVAYRKINMLLKAHARVICVAKNCCVEVSKLIDNQQISYVAREFTATDVDDKMLIICATDDKLLNERVAVLAKRANILINVVDNPDLCSFIMPAIVERSPVVIAISTSAKVPVLARLIRAKIESTIPSAYGELAQLASEFRDKIRIKFSDVGERRRFWENVLSGTIAQKVFSNKFAAAKIELQQRIDAIDDSTSNNIGEVWLVGGGPGDPDLLTFKALRLMQQADVVLYDRLVSSAVVELVRRDAELIYVGKGKDNHPLAQDEINKLLVKLALQGKRVCRLKGGDPFIFGRGGEELEALEQHSIPFQIVPGITAASGCASYSGIPLTHRDYAQSCRFVTGHLKDGSMDLNWRELAEDKQTIVFYMALLGAKYLAKKLIANGMRANMPVALVEKGTTKEHKTYITSLDELPQVIDNNVIQAPTLIIVGAVVALHEKLNWL